MYINIYKDHYVDEKGKSYEILPGDYSLYLIYSTDQYTTEPILINKNFQISSNITKYNVDQFVISSDKDFSDQDQFISTENGMYFFIKGLKELKLQNSDVKDVGVSISYRENGENFGVFKNLINVFEPEAKDYYYYDVNYVKGKPLLDVYINVKYRDNRSEIIKLNRITKK